MRFWLVLLVGCGRIHFDPRSDAWADTAADSAPDIPSCLHTFCDDFERTDVVGPWDSQMLFGGTLAIDSGRLLASSPPVTGARAFLVKALPVVTTSLHFEADISFDAGMDGEIDLVQMHWTDLPLTCTSFGYFLVRDRTNVVEVQETYQACGGVGNQNDILPAFPPSAPSGTHHVAIDVMLGAKNAAQVIGTVDGMAVTKTITAYDVPASHISINLGTPGVNMATAAWAVHYDNVIVDLN